MDDLEPDDRLVDRPLVSPFLESDDDSDDKEVLNELEEYGNAGKLYQKRLYLMRRNLKVLRKCQEDDS
ncbi:hypothetical protein Tco_1554972 [Tanacetum coccineum]